MDRLDSMSVVVSVAETGSLSAASKKIGVSVPTISRKLSDLEAHLNVELFQRSSRRMSLTEAGRSYVAACKRIIEQIEDAEREASGEYRTPTGDLTVTSPWGIGHLHLLPLASEFLAVYPEINLRLLLSDRVLSPMENNIDVGIRIGPLPDSSMVATRIGSIRVVACASPAYLARRGTPVSLDDVSDHDCITIDEVGRPRIWKFAKDGAEVTTPICSRLTVNTSEAAVQAATLGAGIARVMAYKMEAERRAGTLVVILEAFEKEPLPVHILYTERKPMPLKLRVFLNWLTPRLKARLTPFVA
ncbi:LysR family transcriptional regulator [Lichenifustis flavocetrariae]|uniref:LysR family transcriptional regulator n=1 Tax=Lichenifustis flavocetrariae TaxID=2949735 RepID=A0AA41Z733_9HYPH|nr:LysR family transcriptional regulator [Lichenifustis flavocetrariae]MCW6511708.1 LysR family transcriptional regulator [Lichenifustis flavocetrariae]